MKIVIDIPEETINEIKDNAMFAGTIPSEILWDVTSAIVNAKPLDDIKEEIDELDFDFGDFMEYDHSEEIHEMIDKVWNKHTEKERMNETDN